MNQVFYIKPINNDFPTAIKTGFINALAIAKEKSISNIKFIVPHSDFVNDPPNFISDGLNFIWNGQGENFTKALKKNKAFSIPHFPTEAETTGVNLILATKNPSFSVQKTVGLLIGADNESFNKIESALSYYAIDLVVVIFQDSKELNEMLSATKAMNISKTNDPSVISYNNTFGPTEKRILGRLDSISLTNKPSHILTKERIDGVIKDLENENIRISYQDFLGYLVNDVNYRLDFSKELLDRKHIYFGR